MKKIISLMLCLAMLLSVSAFALPVLDVAEKAEISETGTKATLSSETVLFILPVTFQQNLHRLMQMPAI